MSASNNKLPERGFTLIEVTIAIFILAVGLLSAALLASNMMGGGQRSRYMSVAAVLTSEKLEDLNRWSTDDPQICVPTGSATVGNLTADATQTTTCPGGNSASVSYYDDVNSSLSNATAACPGATAGCFSETVSSVVNGAIVYSTTIHSPNGIIQTTTANAAPAAATFHRRWVVEGNSPVNGVRRVTVLVTLMDLSVQPPVTFQMTMVRP